MTSEPTSVTPGFGLLYGPRLGWSRPAVELGIEQLAQVFCGAGFDLEGVNPECHYWRLRKRDGFRHLFILYPHPDDGRPVLRMMKHGATITPKQLEQDLLERGEYGVLLRKILAVRGSDKLLVETRLLGSMPSKRMQKVPRAVAEMQLAAVENLAPLPSWRLCLGGEEALPNTGSLFAHFFPQAADDGLTSLAELLAAPGGRERLLNKFALGGARMATELGVLLGGLPRRPPQY